MMETPSPQDPKVILSPLSKALSAQEVAQSPDSPRKINLRQTVSIENTEGEDTGLKLPLWPRRNTHKKAQSLHIKDEDFPLSELSISGSMSINIPRRSSIDEADKICSSPLASSIDTQDSDSEDEIPDELNPASPPKHIKITHLNSMRRLSPSGIKLSRQSSFYDALKKNANISTSSEALSTTLAKSAATKRFFHEYYYNLFRNQERRLEDLNRIKQQVEEGAISSRNAGAMLSDFFRHHTNELRKRRSKIRRHDFQVLAKIGKGGYGDVFLCRNIKTKAVFAMKRLKIDAINAMNKTTHIQLEKNILSDMRSPWLVHLAYSFQDQKYVYLVMEYVPGGDMRGLLNNLGCFPEEEAKFYLAELILAVLDLHKLSYVHRDLKPENFLITKEGHIKLADFGLSTKGVKASVNVEDIRTILQTSASPANSPANWRRRTFSYTVKPKNQLRTSGKSKEMVGSPHYMAIEVLREKGYDEMIDFWSLGVIFFEMLTGITPFDADTPREVFANILNYKESLANFYREEPLCMSPAASAFIDLLICEPEQRIGRNGLEDFKKQPLYQGFNWDNLLSQTPPFVPKLVDETDVSYFDLNSEKDSSSSIEQMNNFVMKQFYANDDYVEYKYEVNSNHRKSKMDLMRSI